MRTPKTWSSMLSRILGLHRNKKVQKENIDQSKAEPKERCLARIAFTCSPEIFDTFKTTLQCVVEDDMSLSYSNKQKEHTVCLVMENRAIMSLIERLSNYLYNTGYNSHRSILQNFHPNIHGAQKQHSIFVSINYGDISSQSHMMPLSLSLAETILLLHIRDKNIKGDDISYEENGAIRFSPRMETRIIEHFEGKDITKLQETFDCMDIINKPDHYIWCLLLFIFTFRYDDEKETLNNVEGPTPGTPYLQRIISFFDSNTSSHHFTPYSKVETTYYFDTVISGTRRRVSLKFDLNNKIQVIIALGQTNP